MTPSAVLSLARSRSVTLTPEEGRIRFRAPKGAMTPDLKSAIVENRAAVLALLSRRPADLYGWPRLPAGWTTGPVERCTYCGRGTAARDEHGNPKHPNCERS